MKLFCWLVGHNWISQGWWHFKETPPESVDLIFACTRCSLRSRVNESLEHLGARFKDSYIPYPSPDNNPWSIEPKE